MSHVIKYFLIFFLFCFACSSEKEDSVSQRCPGGFQGNYRGELPASSNEIVEIDIFQFSKIISELHKLMLTKTQLNSIHTIQLLRTMNMMSFCNKDYLKKLRFEIPELNFVESFFHESYLAEIKCQYPSYFGRSGCLDFRTLGIQYGCGFSFQSSMYYVKTPLGFTKETFLKDIPREHSILEEDVLLR